MLQKTLSHYTYKCEDDIGHTLFLEFLNHILKLKNFFQEKYNVKIIKNFWNIIPLLKLPEYDQKYYNKVYLSLTKCKKTNFNRAKYYIIKKNLIFLFSNRTLIYEYTLSPVTYKTNKFSGFVAYSLKDIFPAYSVKLSFSNETIELDKNKFHLNLINDYEISLRICELKSINYILTGRDENFSETKKYHDFMEYIKDTNQSLAKIICDNTFINQFTYNNDTILCVLLKKLNKFLNDKKVGYKVILYLLSTLRNYIVKEQLSQSKSSKLSNLFLKENPCLCFEKIPYLYNLKNHKIIYKYLIDVFDGDEYEPQKTAWYIRWLSTRNNQLFVPLKDLNNDITIEIKKINDFNKEIKRIDGFNVSDFNIKITKDKKYCYYSKFFNDTIYILHYLKEFMNRQDGINKYWSTPKTIENTINKNKELFDDDEKNNIIKNLYSQYSLYTIFGVAGSGKTQLIIDILKIFDSKSFKILCLATTNVALNNIKTRNKNLNNNIKFETIYKFNRNKFNDETYDLLVLDECSNISTRQMLGILKKIEKNGIKKILLVGDILQLDSIDYGGWFEIWNQLLKDKEEYKSSYCNLKVVWRGRNNQDLKIFWETIRKRNKNEIKIKLYNNNIGEELSDILNNIEFFKENSIFLCLNYFGLYGINSINEILQQKNNNPPFEWDMKIYKKNDPIIFDNVSENGYSGILFNNLKGCIKDIECPETKKFIKFKIILDTNDFEIGQLKLIENIQNMKYINVENSKPIIELTFNNLSDADYDNDSLLNNNFNCIPFHVAYAISIHKSQGLEYKNVNIVIPDYISDNISFNIFYTAITRAYEGIKIYWSPSTQEKIIDLISNLKNEYSWVDFAIIKGSLKL